MAVVAWMVPSHYLNQCWNIVNWTLRLRIQLTIFQHWFKALGTNFSEILIENQTLLFKKMRLKISSGKWRPFCLSLNVLMNGAFDDHTSHPFDFPSAMKPLWANNKNTTTQITTKPLWRHQMEIFSTFTFPFVWGTTSHWWIPLTKGQLRRPLMFLCYQSKQTAEQTLDWPVNWNAMTVIWLWRNDILHNSLNLIVLCRGTTV